MIDCISKITLYVNDQQQAEEFWVNKMGFVVAFSQQMGENMRWLEVAPHSEAKTTFVLYSKEMMKMQNPATSVEHPSIILVTKTLEQDHQTMKEKGVAVGEIMAFPYGRMFQFQDQDGNRYVLREEQ